MVDRIIISGQRIFQIIGILVVLSEVSLVIHISLNLIKHISRQDISL